MSIISGITLKSNKNIHLNFEGGSRRQPLVRCGVTPYKGVYP